MNPEDTETLKQAIAIREEQIALNIRRGKNDKLLLDRLERLNRPTIKVLIGTTLVTITKQQGGNVQVHTSEIDGIVT